MKLEVVFVVDLDSLDRGFSESVRVPWPAISFGAGKARRDKARGGREGP